MDHILRAAGTTGSRPALPPAHTYSIVACDPEARQLGAAVQSHYFCVGKVVPWAEPGIGAVATQSFAEISYGPLGLAMMRAGKSAGQALEGLLASDPQADLRQVAMADGKGNVAVHTGRRCIAAAGHRQGAGYSTQANLMLRDTVWEAMGRAFETASGDLAERMLAALEAAEEEGGDIRGRQSAALLVVSSDLAPAPWSGRLFDLRVDDQAEPLRELRRLLAIARAYDRASAASDILRDASLEAAKKLEASSRLYRQAAAAPEMAGNPELVFWHAVDLVGAGQVEAALPLFGQAFAAGPAWRDLIPRLAAAELLPDDAALLDRILSTG